MKRNLFLPILFLLCMVSCKKDLKTIIAETEDATFIIYTFDEYGSPSGSGSGFFIDKEGTGITNYHVLDESVKAILKTKEGQIYEIDKVTASDKQWDIVKFSTKHDPSEKFAYLDFSRRKAENGDRIYNISAPLGLEQTISEGIVSSLRQDSHGEIIQITAPISPGSSGSAILDDNGDVIAVATFGRTGGQNLNFGVSIDDEKINALTDNTFSKENPLFNKKENFLILNLRAKRSNNIILNALEFKDDATIGYFSFTNLDIFAGDHYIWCELNKGDEGFMILDKESGEKYHLTSSTLGVNKANGTHVPVASTYRFKVFFPAINHPEKLRFIDITYGHTSRGWQFTNIDLDIFRNELHYDTENYQKDYGYASMHEGDVAIAQEIFTNILKERPDDEQVLNAMGILSFSINNFSDAEYFFSKSIEEHPNSVTAYINRASLYQYQKNYDSALQDLNHVININPEQPDHYCYRALVYMNQEQWEKAKNDLDKAIETEDFKTDPVAYYYRAICNTWMKNFSDASRDVEIAYNLTNDPDFENALQELYQKLP